MRLTSQAPCQAPPFAAFLKLMGPLGSWGPLGRAVFNLLETSQFSTKSETQSKLQQGRIHAMDSQPAHVNPALGPSGRAARKKRGSTAINLDYYSFSSDDEERGVSSLQEQNEYFDFTPAHLDSFLDFSLSLDTGDWSLQDGHAGETTPSAESVESGESTPDSPATPSAGGEGRKNDRRKKRPPRRYVGDQLVVRPPLDTRFISANFWHCTDISICQPHQNLVYQLDH